MPTLRLADPHTASRYPLAVQGAARWLRRGDSWQLTVLLPELGAGTLLLPSLTSSPACTPQVPPDPLLEVQAHQWTLTAGETTWSLQHVPASAEPPQRPTPGSAVSTHIDCFHVHKRLPRAELRVTVKDGREPHRYLVCVSARALTMAAPPRPSSAAALARAPAPRSQMTAPEAIASRICSPTCVSMVLDLWERGHEWLAVVQECHDPGSGLYGVWPLALAAAARRGCAGAVEAFGDWAEPLEVLRGGVPLVTSIRFFPGELPGAPLEETGGHLVVVYGVTPETVHVCDPAAPEGGVVREYPAEAFSRAWLRHRGAAYILAP